jgi:ELWxxDGT repeat protein
LEDRCLLAATLELLATNPTAAGSSISQFAQSNNTAFFFSDDAIHGKELWKTDGTSEGTLLVKDIAAGADSSSVDPHMADFIGVLFFTADDGTHGTELW